MTTHAVIFAPLGQATRAEQVVERLTNAIVSGLLEAHEQLPNEADLAKSMGVSHITIREALNTLRTKEFIYTTRGRNGGSFVCQRTQSIDNEHPLKQMSTNYLADLGELHCAIMKHSISLAIERSTAKEQQKLEEFIELFFEATTPEQKAHADMRCLLTIAANAQSPRLAQQALSIQTEWASLIAMLYRDDAIYQQTVQTYQQLLHCFSQHDDVNATRLMGKMILALTEDLIELKFKIERKLVE